MLDGKWEWLLSLTQVLLTADNECPRSHSRYERICYLPDLIHHCVSTTTIKLLDCLYHKVVIIHTSYTRTVTSPNLLTFARIKSYNSKRAIEIKPEFITYSYTSQNIPSFNNYSTSYRLLVHTLGLAMLVFFCNLGFNFT